MRSARSTVLVGLTLGLGLAALAVSGPGSGPDPIASARVQPTGLPAPEVREAVRVDPSSPAVVSTEREELGATTAALRGTLRGEDGRAVGSGVVTLRGGGRPQRTLAVASDGAFGFEGLEPGTWQLLARGPGFASAAVFVEDLAAGEVREQDVPVVVGARIRGEVLGADGRPLAGARVTPWRRGPDGDELDPETAVETDRGGLFELGAGDARWCQVQVTFEGHETRSLRLDASRFARIRLSSQQD